MDESGMSCQRSDQEFDLGRLRREAGLRQLEFHPELPSTNDRALELAAAADVEVPALVLASRQTAGRGRGGNRWWSAPGALTFSWIVDAGRIGLSTRQRPKLSLAAGLAVCEALQGLDEAGGARGVAFQLKWPNDVFLEGRKLGGILVEAPPGRPGRLVVGIGINLNNSLDSAPAEVRETAVSFIDVCGRVLSPTEALIRVVRHLRDCMEQLAEDAEGLLQRWEERSLFSGSLVLLDLGSRRVAGMCRGVDIDGALVLQTEHGLERFFSGVVRRFE